jgi:hypothetical protein
MSLRHLFVAAAIITTSLAFGAAPPATPVSSGVAPPCDRACMTSLVDRHLAAVVKHDPAGLPLGGSSSSMQAGELFRIDRGRITAVEAMGASLPYGTKSGWGE